MNLITSVKIKTLKAVTKHFLYVATHGAGAVCIYVHNLCFSQGQIFIISLGLGGGVWTNHGGV